jgi:ankyrin repeat protein
MAAATHTEWIGKPLAGFLENIVALGHSASARDIDYIRRLIQICTSLVHRIRDDDINRQYNGHGLLSWSLQWKETRGVALELLKRNAKVDIHSQLFKETPLHLAAQEGDLAMARELLQRGADVDATCKLGRTAMHDAKSHDIIEVLKENKATIDAHDNEDHTPLHFAAVELRPETIDLLLDAGADANARSKDGSTPLHFAAAVVGNSKTVSALLNGGARVDEGDNHGYTALHLAAAESDYQDTVQVLLANHATVNIENDEGDTPLHLAVQRPQPKATEALLGAGADANYKNIHGETPLHLAVQSENPDTVKALLSSDAAVDVDIEDMQGRTALHIAEENKCTEIVRLLINHSKRCRR